MFARTQTSVKEYSQTQKSMVTTAMLTAGIGFLLTCGIGYLVSLLWEKIGYGNYYDAYVAAQQLNTLYIVSSIGILVSMILSFVWMFKMSNASYGLAFTTISIYCLSQGVGFGSLFYVFDVREILLIFGIIGFILFSMYAMSKVISAKTALTLGKISIYGFISYMIVVLILTLVSMFLTSGTLQTIMLVVTFAGGLLSLIYLIYIFWALQRTNEFLQGDETLRKKVAIFYGFQILIELIALVWRIASIILYFKD